VQRAGPAPFRQAPASVRPQPERLASVRQERTRVASGLVSE